VRKIAGQHVGVLEHVGDFTSAMSYLPNVEPQGKTLGAFITSNFGIPQREQSNWSNALVMPLLTLRPRFAN
jgi:hypothetical protein